MLQIVRIYYDIKTKYEYESFLFNHLIRNYLEKGDLRITKNINMQNQRYLKLMEDNEIEIEISCRPLIETATQGYHADIIYIQNTALYKTSSDILNNLPLMFVNKQPEIYIFNGSGVIGKWNTD